MANISLDFTSFTFPAQEISSWKEFREEFQIKNPDLFAAALDARALYVVRLCPPFIIAYEKKNSPAIYIGRGHFQERITAHLKNWIHPLSKDIPNLKIEILTCQPRARRNYDAFKNVEADMLWEFEQEFGRKPLKNKVGGAEHHHVHVYNNKSRIWQDGQGKKYKWALRPTELNRL